jgi:hypothetical protein
MAQQQNNQSGSQKGNAGGMKRPGSAGTDTRTGAGSGTGAGQTSRPGQTGQSDRSGRSSVKPDAK